MSNLTVIGAAIAVFLIAALLYYQSHAEGFANPPLESPTAGRWFNPTPGEPPMGDSRWPVPADLNKAPVTYSLRDLPTAQPRPAAIPSAGQAPKSALATRRDLFELDAQINIWLSGIDQRERELKGALSAEQGQRRIILQGRLSEVRSQIATGLITDTYHQVRDETTQLQRDNAAWKKRMPNLDAIAAFGMDQSPDAFLDATHYAQFKQFFGAILSEYSAQPQPDPIQRVRLQQLQVFHQSLGDAERTSPQGLPPIRFAAAQMFLKQALRPDQPLPTLFSMEPNPATLAAPHTQTTTDIVSDLRDIQWKLQVSYDPAGQELKRSVAALLDQVQRNSATMTPAQVETARRHVAALNASRVPPAIPAAAAAAPAAPAPTPLQYDPANLQRRATTLCRQIREAFPHDAAALGCPDKTPDNEFEAETVINTVCSRLYTSVPTVDPAQFNCPKGTV